MYRRRANSGDPRVVRKGEQPEQFYSPITFVLREATIDTQTLQNVSF